MSIENVITRIRELEAERTKYKKQIAEITSFLTSEKYQTFSAVWREIKIKHILGVTE